MLTTLPKLIFSFALIYWLISSGKIDFNILYQSLDYKTGWLFCLSIFILNTLVVTLRWKKILEVKSEKIFPYLSVLKMTWIGNLFNTVLPGVVSGDFIKLFYVKKYDPKLNKTFLITSVFMDRILGLISLLVILGVSSIFNYQKLISISPQIKYLMNLNFLIFIGMTIFLLTLFLPQKPQRLILDLLVKIPFAGRLAHKTFSQFWLIGENKKKIFYLIALGIFSQTLNMTAFWVLMQPYIQYASQESVKLMMTDAFSFIPLGFVAVAIPITPSGLGVGHAAFDTLFSYFGVVNGASLFNFQFLANVCVNLMGIFPYLTNKSKHSKEEIQAFEEMSR